MPRRQSVSGFEALDHYKTLPGTIFPGHGAPGAKELLAQISAMYARNCNTVIDRVPACLAAPYGREQRVPSE